MTDEPVTRRVAALNDVDLVRLLTTDVEAQTDEVRHAAQMEADRRGLPIDEAFIPRAAQEPASGRDACRYEVAGVKVACTHCRGALFESRQVLLNTRGLTFFNLDWLNRAATALVCRNCGLVQIFAGGTAPTERE